MNLTANDLVTVMTAAGILVGAIGVVVVNIITALRTTAAVKKNTAVLTEVSAKTDVIEGFANSRASKDAEQIAGLQRENATLTGQLAEQKAANALLTQSLGHVATAAAAVRPARSTDPPSAPIPVDVVNEPTVTIADKLPPPDSGPS